MEPKEARGVILGYEVNYAPTKQPGLKRTINTKDQKAILEVTAEDYDVTVTAYNTAGHSPSTNLRVSAGVFHSERFPPLKIKNIYFRTNFMLPFMLCKGMLDKIF